jgi:UDP-GlcNAc:undecaprenyl-phosphate GlcNAc-1-phosphate transferase
MPWYMSGGAVFFIALILFSKVFKPEMKKSVIRIAIYSTIPLLIYFSTISASPWMTEKMIVINDSFFIGLVFLVIVTLNLTRRQKGFKINPLDFLIFIVIIILPNLPSVHLEGSLMKMVISKVLILFFSYDVFLGEIRPKDTFLDKSLLAAFCVIALKAFI